MHEVYKSEILTLPGSYGDSGVKLSRLFPERPEGTHVLLLHGVHSTANLSPHNKFKHLAELLASRGFTPWLCETSRRVIDREKCADMRGWIYGAFSGKCFRDEMADCAASLARVLREAPKRLWLWGFSMGGLIAWALVCGKNGTKAERIITSGTGLVSMPWAEREMIPLPILSTLRETLDPEMLKCVAAEEAVAFRGEHDEVFSERACLDLLDAAAMPEEKKKFYTIRGADHSMKMRDGKHDGKIMDEMLSLLLEG